MWLWADADNDKGTTAQIPGKSLCPSSCNHKVALKSTQFPTDLRTLQAGRAMAGYLTIPRGKMAFLVASRVPSMQL